MITLITPTGTRPEAFALCEKMMARQTYKGPRQWIVVDDGEVQTKCTMKQEYYRGPKIWTPGINTQRLNMDVALQKAKGEFIFVIEDDDWYHPTYIEHMLEMLKHADIAGEGLAKYFNLQVPGYKEMQNQAHASLSQTAIRGRIKDFLYKAVNSGEKYFDIELWKTAHRYECSMVIASNTKTTIGIKGFPGREGIGAGHRAKDCIYNPDLSKLKAWIGDEYKMYIPFIKGFKNEPAKPATSVRRDTRIASNEHLSNKNSKRA